MRSRESIVELDKNRVWHPDAETRTSVPPRRGRFRGAAVVAAVIGFAGVALAEEPAAEPIPNLRVPRAEVVTAGPSRDSIRSVDTPELVALDGAVSWVKPHNPVVGVEVDGDARAYPVHLLEHHQIVNDVIGGKPFAITFDPLTSSPIVYRASVEGRRLTFGFSGLLYRANALLYDRETDSLWSQFTGVAIAGPLAGQRLERVRSRQEPLGVWIQRHPESKVLARPELKRIDYRYSPYSAYWVSESFPPLAEKRVDRSYHPKEVVLGVEVDGASRVYLGSRLTAAGSRIVDQFQGHELKIAYDGESATFIWEAPEPVQVTDAYWFAWYAHHPDAEVWKLKESAPGPP